MQLYSFSSCARRCFIFVFVIFYFIFSPGEMRYLWLLCLPSLRLDIKILKCKRQAGRRGRASSIIYLFTFLSFCSFSRSGGYTFADTHALLPFALLGVFLASTTTAHTQIEMESRNCAQNEKHKKEHTFCEWATYTDTLTAVAIR